MVLPLPRVNVTHVLLTPVNFLLPAEFLSGTVYSTNPIYISKTTPAVNYSSGWGGRGELCLFAGLVELKYIYLNTKVAFD